MENKEANPWRARALRSTQPGAGIRHLYLTFHPRRPYAYYIIIVRY